VQSTSISWASVRHTVLKHDGYVCQSCGAFVGARHGPFLTAHIHHETPRSQGGADDPENLTTLCRDCHDDRHDHSVFQADHGTGRTTNAKGYALVKRPLHPDAHKNGYAYEHRVVAEQMLGRRLRDHEEVHHKNGDKQDNRPENLEVLTVSEHRSFHSQEQDAPTQSAVLEVLSADGYAKREQIIEQTDRTESAVTSALAELREKGEVKNPRRGWWALPAESLPGKSKQERAMSDETVECACGCGQTLTRYDEYGRERRYISGHNTPERPSPVQDDVLTILRDEGGEVATSTLYEQVTATNSKKAIGSALRTLCNEELVADRGYGTWALADNEGDA
jgi:5-methylcytosine-specific restriction endonuclease McrA